MNMHHTHFNTPLDQTPHRDLTLITRSEKEGGRLPESALPEMMYHRLIFIKNTNECQKRKEDRQDNQCKSSSSVIARSGDSYILLYKPAFKKTKKVLKGSQYDLDVIKEFSFTDAALLDGINNSVIMGELSVFADLTIQVSSGDILRICDLLNEAEDNVEALNTVVEVILRFMLSKRLNYRPEWLVDLFDYLGEHCPRSTSIATLASQAGLSQSHFSRSFSNLLGMAPSKFLQEICFARVRSMILADNGAYTFSEIAAHCNFADQSHFCRTFKSRSGMKPQDYRNYLFHP